MSGSSRATPIKVADTHGIVYTPQEIVDFMCASVAEVLQSEFGKTLGDKDVQILDPCTGTGNFIVNLLRRIPKRDLPRMYRQQLFANEVMLLPYYIAALNIEHAYYELTGKLRAVWRAVLRRHAGPGEGPAEHVRFHGAGERRSAWNAERDAPITVIIGNPPYNAGQLNENDNNKNRKYEVIDRRISETYAKDSTATNKNALYDPYVKFFRWAVDRLKGATASCASSPTTALSTRSPSTGCGSTCSQDFTRDLPVHLEGNVRHNPKLSGHDVQRLRHPGRRRDHGGGQSQGAMARMNLKFHRVEKTLRKDKLNLRGWRSTGASRAWIGPRSQPDQRNTWLVPDNADEFAAFRSDWEQGRQDRGDADARTIFRSCRWRGTQPRQHCLRFRSRMPLAKRVGRFVEDYNAEVDRYNRRRRRSGSDDFVRYDKIKWSETLRGTCRRGEYAEFD